MIRLAAQHTLLSLSAAAAATTRPSGRYVVITYQDNGHPCCLCDRRQRDGGASSEPP